MHHQTGAAVEEQPGDKPVFNVDRKEPFGSRTGLMDANVERRTSADGAVVTGGRYTTPCIMGS